MSDNIYTYDSVNFHKTFIPEEVYITKILELAERNYSGTKEQISDVTGIPTGKISGKVIPHIKYANYMGMINYQLEKSVFTLSLTEFGETVLIQDKHLFEDITKLICHFNMCDKDNGAYIWSFIYFKQSMMFEEKISFDLLKKKCHDLFLIDPDFSPFKRSYRDDGFWGKLGIFDPQAISEKSGDLCLNSLFYNDSFKFAYAYTLFSAWDHYLQETVEITTDQIADTLMWNKRLGFDESEMLFVLEELEAEGLVRLNKQLVPYTVIRTAETNDVLPRIYELLS